VKQTTPTDFTHQNNSTLGKKTCGFGVGNRFNTRKNSSPGPGEHKMGTVFDEGNPVYRSSKATEWGKRCSRDAYISALNPGKMLHIRGESPGPGHYKYKNMSCGSDTKKFTFRRRTLNLNEPESMMIRQNLPGPGNYGVSHGLGINKIGKYYVSNMPNSRCSVFSPGKRFRTQSSIGTQGPGPGTYMPDDVSVKEDKVRKYVLSNFKTNAGSRMVMPYKTINGDRPDVTDRSVKCRLDTPGPGQYILPSDFGHLESFRGEGSPRRGNT